MAKILYLLQQSFGVIKFTVFRLNYNNKEIKDSVGDGHRLGIPNTSSTDNNSRQFKLLRPQF